MSVRVRFAPSPTGNVHIGNIRAAIFNWLFARHADGAFLLRVEDTDLERSTPEAIETLLRVMAWLGLDYDEEPVYQSARAERHLEVVEQLLASGAAYREEREGGGECVVFRMPAAGRLEFQDAVKGRMRKKAEDSPDFVIVRSNGTPVFHLANVVDDVDMGMTHVIRGDDHISNTPKQVLLYEAVGAPVPSFAHVPLILGPDKKRLSKRHGATSVMEYARQGVLPEAMVNFLALLGWSPGSGDREIFTRDELAEVFDLGGISGGNAVFNPEKLEWFNQQHLMRLAPDELVRRLKPLLEEAGSWHDDFAGDRHAWFFAVVELLKPRAKRLHDFVPLGEYFFRDEIVVDRAAAEKHLRAAGMPGHLEALAAAWDALDSFDAASLEASLRALADARGVKAGALIHAVRVAVTGRANSPGLFEVVALVGRDRTLARLAAAARIF